MKIPTSMAFPIQIKDTANQTILYSRGLTKRELFAAFAMVGCIFSGMHGQAESIAKRSAELADALAKILRTVT
jgi:hypothetical protein